MHGLVSLLPEPFYTQVESTWQELERDFGLTGIRVTPSPHFSWQVVQDYDWEHIAGVLQDIAQQTSPLPVRTTGLGLFTGARPVIYVPVVKSAGLLRLHQLVWERTAQVSTGQLAYYAPEAWMPHVSLAHEDVHQGNVGRVMERLAWQSFDWEMVVDNIALVYQPAGEVGTVKYRFEL